MDLDELRRHWDRFGADDPLWAILTAPDKRHGRWEIGEFFATGTSEINRVLSTSAEVIGRPLRTGRALDFGCGVGRLTQALAAHFDLVDGVDIAASMIEQARRLDHHPGQCTYHVNEQPDLTLFADDTFDFAYTAHVLQHMDPALAAGYVRELVRVLRPGGVLVFQVTTQPATGATEALPDDAYRADVRLLDAPRKLAAGRTARVRVQVTNTSDDVFPAAGTNGWFQVTVGNHWDNVAGERVQVDDARTPLPADLAPGETTVVELDVRAPQTRGAYALVVELCQEGVAWFADRGATPATARVSVTREWRRPTEAAFVPQMEMYGTPVAEASTWVTSAGAEVVAVRDWDELFQRPPEPDWVRTLFFAVKPE